MQFFCSPFNYEMFLIKFSFVIVPIMVVYGGDIQFYLLQIILIPLNILFIIKILCKYKPFPIGCFPSMICWGVNKQSWNCFIHLWLRHWYTVSNFVFSFPEKKKINDNFNQWHYIIILIHRRTGIHYF